MNNAKQIRLLIDPDIIDECDKLAKAHSRSFNAQINTLLRLVLNLPRPDSSKEGD